MDSPGSPLSELSSEDFTEDVKIEDRSMSADTFHDVDHDSVRPTKRQRTGPSGLSNLRANSAEIGQTHDPDPDADIYISEDTEGSVPASPNHPTGYGGIQDEEAMGQEQVTVCKWEGCETGDLGNMDNLVEHLHEDHIGTRQKKYSCEWTDCSRKGIPHASGYALRAHMRSHTREKPFYCTLPECDRAFTRSDALAKHMRTVHETEALRPSDPVPKHHSSNPSNKAQRLRLVFKEGLGGKPSGSPLPASPSAAAPHTHPETEYEHNNITFRSSSDGPDTAPRGAPKFPHDIHFTAAELALAPPQLVQLLRRQIHWAEREATALKAECDALEKQRRDEWTAKELAVENVMEAELARMQRVDRFLRAEENAPLLEGLAEDVAVARKLEVRPEPAAWRRGPLEREAVAGREGLEAAGALVGMAGAGAAAASEGFDAAGDAVVERRPESLGIGVAGGVP